MTDNIYGKLLNVIKYKWSVLLTYKATLGYNIYQQIDLV